MSSNRVNLDRDRDRPRLPPLTKANYLEWEEERKELFWEKNLDRVLSKSKQGDEAYDKDKRKAWGAVWKSVPKHVKQTQKFRNIAKGDFKELEKALATWAQGDEGATIDSLNARWDDLQWAPRQSFDLFKGEMDDVCTKLAQHANEAPSDSR